MSGRDTSGGAGQPSKSEDIDTLVAFLTPSVEDVLSRLEGEEFTTVDFVEILQTDPAAKAAYEEALRRWGESEHRAKMVVHGQVIPAILRHSAWVEWQGFAYGVPDPYAVPAWWRLLPSGN